MAIDLDSATTGTQNSQALSYNAGNAQSAKTLLPSIAASGDTDIATIQISVGGAGLSASQDQLLPGGDTLSLNRTAQPGSQSITVGAGSVGVARN